MKKTLLTIIVLLTMVQLNAQVTVALGSVYEVVAGTKVYIPVTVTGLDAANSGTPITAAEFHIFFNNQNVEYDTTANISALTPPAEWIYGASATQYGSTWVDDNLNAISFPDGTVLFEVVFDYKGGETILDLDSSRCYLVDANFSYIPVAQVIDGIITPAAGSDQSVWTGEGDWNTSANWSNGVPGINTIAVIESGNTEINSGSNCKSLLVNAGASVHVMPGFSLSVSEGITSNGGFFIESDASGTGSVISNGAVTGTGTFSTEQYVDFSSSHSHLVCSPLPSATGVVFSGLNPEKYTESSAAFESLGESDVIPNASGVRVTSDSPSTMVFSGAFNSAGVTLSNLPFSDLNEMEHKGLNLIGNPFTSALFADLPLWTKSGVGNGVYVWDGYKFKCWNGITGNLTDGLIPAMQGFFVRTDNANASLDIPAASRIHSNAPFYKSSKDNLLNHLVLRFEKKDDPDHFDEAFIHVKEGSVINYSSESDVIKLTGNPDFPQIWTLSSDNTSLAVNTQPDFETSIPVSFKVKGAGKYQLSVSGIESLGSETPLYLEDKQDASTIWNLRLSPVIEFNFGEGASTGNRYVLHFNVIGINELEKDYFKVYLSNGSIHIEAEQQKRIEQVELVSLTGQLLGMYENLTTPSVIRLEKCSGGIAILRIRTVEGIYIKKLLTAN
ncbi:MAG: hypothetical protein FD166_3527 [Bacteroidetes bacterium]|nr:MAG: hypothetical protein FD166_3527 [Bacteroidota bacterium]